MVKAKKGKKTGKIFAIALAAAIVPGSIMAIVGNWPPAAHQRLRAAHRHGR